MVPEKIEQEVQIAAPAERVWQVLTEAEHIKAWYAFDGAEVDLEPGGTLTFHWDEHGTYHAAVTQVEPPKRFAFQLCTKAGEKPSEGHATTVEFALSAKGGGTHLRLTETGFQDLAGSDEENAQLAQDQSDGWEVGLAELKKLAEKSA
jgi:uncharacterized protein YndB with AHSA1/START domain